MGGASIVDYLGWAREQTIPPLCLQLVLRSGTSFWLAYVFRFEPSDPMIIMRVWDMQTMDDSDMAQLKANLSRVHDRSASDYTQQLHPKLAQANLRVQPDSIECLVEWHDRIWPGDLIREDRQPPGFRTPVSP